MTLPNHNITLHGMYNYIHSQTGVDCNELDEFSSETLSKTFMFLNKNLDRSDLSNNELLNDIAKSWVVDSISMLIMNKTNHMHLKDIKITENDFMREKLIRKFEEIKSKIFV